MFVLANTAGASAVTPAASKTTLFVDASGVPSTKDAGGAVVQLLSGPAAAAAYQPLNANLTGISSVTVANDQALALIGGNWTTYALTAVARTLLAATTVPLQRAALGAADDTLVVHNFGAETIGGSKTCTDTWRWNLGTTGSIQYSTPGGNPGISLRNGNPASGDDAAFRTDLRAGAGSLSIAVATAAGSASPTAGIVINPSQSMYPIVTNAMSCGRAGNVWTQVFATNTPISTSDASLKTEPRQLRDAEFKAASAIARLPAVWRWLNRVHGDENCEPEGKEARKHFGPTVQAAMAVMEANGLDPFAYSFICYDEWEAEPERWHEWPAKEPVYEVIPAVLDDEGDVVEPERTVLIEPAVEAGRELIQPAREAGDRYSFRKEELLCFIVRALAQEIDGLSDRVAALEAKG